MTDDPDPAQPGPRGDGADDTVVARRRAGGTAPADRRGPDTSPMQTMPDAEASTRIARPRVSRSTGADDVPAPLGRVARSPERGPTAWPGGEPRPVVVPRAPAPGAGRQTPVDAASIAAHRRRRARRRLIAAGLVALAVAVGAVTALVVLLSL